MPSARRLTGRHILTLSLAVAAAAHAQTAAGDDAVIALSPFEVSSTQDTGYQTNDTLAGSRLRTNLGDIASSVNVFTPELLSDIGATNEMDVMRYSSSAEQERTDQTPAVQGILPLQGAFNFRIRGQTATRARNYFETNIASDTFNTETVEEARGPNAILFGLGGAGGVYNTSTKKALLGREMTTVGLVLDNHDEKRATLDYNRPFGKKFSMRLNLLSDTSGGWEPYSDARATRAAFAATYRPSKILTIRFDTEYGKANAPTTRYFAPIDGVSLWKLSGSPEVANAVLTASTAQRAIGITNRNATSPIITLVGNDASFHNAQGTAVSAPIGSVPPNLSNSTLFPSLWDSFDTTNPYPKKANFSGIGGRITNGQGVYNLSVELQPVKNLFVELATDYDSHFNHYYDFVPGTIPLGMNGTPFNTIFGEPAQTYRDGTRNPYAGDYYLDGRWVYRTTYTFSSRYRGTVAYTLDLGKFGHHTIAALASRDRTDAPARTLFYGLQGSPFAASPFANQNLIYFRQYITNPADLSQWAVPSYQPLVGQPVSVVLNPGAAPTTYQSGWIDNNPGGHTDPIQIERAGMVSMQNYFFHDRLVTTEGFRRTLNYGQTSPTNIARTTIDNGSYGVVAKATSWLSGFYNFSQNAVAPSSVQTVIPYNNLLPINKGQGYDTGVMLKLFDNRFSLRLGYYNTTSLDQAKAAAAGPNVVTRNQNIVNAMLAAGMSVPDAVRNISGGDFDASDVVTKGYELNLTANPTRNWRLMFNATKSTSTSTNLLKLTNASQAIFLPVWQTPAAQNLVTANGITVAQEIANYYNNFYNPGVAGNGRSTIGHRPLQLRLFTRYDVTTTRLKGLFFGGGLSYDSAPIIGYNTTTGAPFKDHVQREMDLLLGYKVRLPAEYKRAMLTLQFNAQNILHQYDFIAFSAQGDGQIVRAGVVAPPRYALSTTLSF